MALPPFRVMSIADGSGASELAIKLAIPTARTVCRVEWEAYACAHLVSRMEAGDLDAAPLWSDARTFNGWPWRGAVDCVVAGYPCQPFSSAGLRLGHDDERNLWLALARIVMQVAPRYVFVENVARHLSHGFEEVARELHRLGYRVAAGLFSAAEVGAPHVRVRLFALAQLVAGQRTPDAVRMVETLPDTSSTGWQGQGGKRHAHAGWSSGGPNDDGESRAWWQAEPGVGRVALRVAARVHRLRLLGNGWVPLAGAYAFATLLTALARTTDE